MKKNKLRLIDFFSGAGGLTNGFRVAGIEVIAGIDNDGSCKKTYEINNKGSVFLEKDIRIYSPVNLEKDLGISKNDDNVIFAGCAPCQFWTLINTTKEKSEKTKNLIFDFLKFVEYFSPGFVVVENVPGISSKKGSPMGKFIDKLKCLNYMVDYDVIDMSLFGIPQKRRRFTLLASRISKILLPRPTNVIRTVESVLGTKNGFPKIEAGTRDKTKFLHTVAGLSKKNLERLRMTEKNGGNRSKWQKKKGYQLDCYSSGNNKFFDTYGRMWWDRPSPTITTKFISVSNGRFAHPDENRGISLREGATLQTFPSDYEFVDESICSIARMIGNAVPPEFAKIIGKQIMESVNEANYACK